MMPYRVIVLCILEVGTVMMESECTCTKREWVAKCTVSVICFKIRIRWIRFAIPSSCSLDIGNRSLLFVLAISRLHSICQQHSHSQWHLICGLCIGVGHLVGMCIGIHMWLLASSALRTAYVPRPACVLAFVPRLSGAEIVAKQRRQLIMTLPTIKETVPK